MILAIKIEHCFDSEGWNIKNVAQDGRHLVSKDISDQKAQYKTF